MRFYDVALRREIAESHVIEIDQELKYFWSARIGLNRIRS